MMFLLPTLSPRRLLKLPKSLLVNFQIAIPRATDLL